MRSLWRSAWKAVALFAYRRWAEPNGEMPVGVPSFRDPEHICTGYEPRKRGPGDYAECEGDGHYLCAGCAHRAPDEEDAA